MNNVVQCNDTHYKKKGYAANLEINNCKNNVQVALNAAKLAKHSDFAQNTMNGCVYMDAENKWEHLTGRLMVTLQAEKQNNINNSEILPESVIIHCNQSWA